MTFRLPYIRPAKQPPARASIESVATPLCLLAAFIAGQATEMRAAYLTPPAKPRINQIDQSRSLNLPPTTLPFNQYDWSKPFFPVIRVDNHRSTNINLLTNPIPFGPYDYSDGPYPVRRYAPDQIYPNLTLTVTPPSLPPFVSDYSDGAYNVRRYAPDQTYPNIALLNPPPQAPPFTPDYSDGPYSVRRYAPDQVYPNIALLTFVVPAVEPRTPYLSPPFHFRVNQIDVQAVNIALTAAPVAMPFGPFDWSKAVQPRALPVIPAPPYNPNLYTNPIPFGPYDYNIAHAVIHSPPQAAPYNINIFVNPIPFGPFDWTARAPQMPSRAPDQIERNPNIFSEVPTVPIDWSARPQQFPPRQPDQIYPDIAINVTPPPQAPFAQYDWSKPFFPPPSRDTTQPTNINLYQNPIPFGPYDLSYRPSQFPPRAPDQLYYNIVLNITAAQPPFIPVDYSKPFFPRVLKENAPQTNVNLFTNPIPLGPYDWSARPYQYPPRAPDVFHRNPLIFSEVPLIVRDFSRPVRVTAPPLVTFAAYNVALYQPPPIAIDLSSSRRVPGLPPLPQPYNIALLTPTGPAPFIPIDWSKPFAVRQAALQAQLNLTLTLPPPQPAPIVPFDWNRPYAVRIAPPQPYPNLTLFLPPPAIIGVPGLAFSKDFAIASSRAYEMVLAKARPADIVLWRGQAKDLGTARATVMDLAQYRATASEGGRQPGFGFRFGVIYPLILDISPKFGPSGTLVTITGTGFLGVTGVDFGGVPAAFTVVSDTTITATVP